MEAHLEFYCKHSRWSNPGRYNSHISEIAPVPEAVTHAVSGLIMHAWLAKMRNVEMPTSGIEDYWDGRSVQRIIDVILSRDRSPLTVSRSLENRFFGCCRHYALVAASIFRTHAVPARIRAGFATYFTSGFFEDHWVCEYWHNGQWRLLDAELDSMAVKDYNIAFQPWDVPRDRFIDASTAWHHLRNDEIDQESRPVDNWHFRHVVCRRQRPAGHRSAQQRGNASVGYLVGRA